MDDATLRYLIPKKIKIPGVPYVIDKTCVQDLTTRLLNGDVPESLKDPFEAYVDACMTYNMRRESVSSAPSTPLFADTLCAPKRLTAFVKRKNNVLALYDRAKNLQEGQVCAGASTNPNVLCETGPGLTKVHVESKTPDKSHKGDRPQGHLERAPKEKRVRSRIVLDDRVGSAPSQTPVRPFYAVELDAQPQRMAFERRNYRGLETV